MKSSRSSNASTYAISGYRGPSVGLPPVHSTERCSSTSALQVSKVLMVVGAYVQKKLKTHICCIARRVARLLLIRHLISRSNNLLENE